MGTHNGGIEAWEARPRERAGPPLRRSSACRSSCVGISTRENAQREIGEWEAHPQSRPTGRRARGFLR